MSELDGVVRTASSARRSRGSRLLAVAGAVATGAGSVVFAARVTANTAAFLAVSAYVAPFAALAAVTVTDAGGRLCLAAVRVVSRLPQRSAMTEA